jgi:hypothetical protein
MMTTTMGHAAPIGLLKVSKEIRTMDRRVREAQSRFNERIQRAQMAYHEELKRAVESAAATDAGAASEAVAS